AQRQTLREVVVDRPAQTGARDGERSDRLRLKLAWGVAKSDSAAQYECCSEYSSKPQVLSEEQDRQSHRKRSLEVQEQRSRNARASADPVHHQPRPNDPPETDDAEQVAPARPLETCLAPALARAPRETCSGEPQAPAEVQQSRQNHRTCLR